MPLLFSSSPIHCLSSCSVLALFPHSHSLGSIWISLRFLPFKSPLPYPSLLSLCPILALRLSAQSFSPYLVQHHLQQHWLWSLKHKKVIEIPLCLASLMFLLCYFCTVPPPSLLSVDSLLHTLCIFLACVAWGMQSRDSDVFSGP